jgi:REP element-mobilizing transposase RayT
MPRSIDLRKGRVSLRGQIYHVTSVTAGRAPIFADFARARDLILAIKKSDELLRSHTLAFVVMPDHLHWLLELRGSAPLGQVVGAVKSASARGVTWQAGFYDHALRRQDDVQALARYIVANPVRAGLVARVGDYSHWDAAWVV